MTEGKTVTIHIEGNGPFAACDMARDCPKFSVVDWGLPDRMRAKADRKFICHAALIGGVIGGILAVVLS